MCVLVAWKNTVCIRDDTKSWMDISAPAQFHSWSFIHFYRTIRIHIGTRPALFLFAANFALCEKSMCQPITDLYIQQYVECGMYLGAWCTFFFSHEHTLLITFNVRCGSVQYSLITKIDNPQVSLSIQIQGAMRCSFELTVDSVDTSYGTCIDLFILYLLMIMCGFDLS